jgi:hypothetical protein
MYWIDTGSISTFELDVVRLRFADEVELVLEAGAAAAFDAHAK